ncbi:hypothetical protein HGA91_04020 [candidate division WWE3 bacterium]|nr:hypothetical protein [candidate division WWE3 bacterium]
MSSGQRLWKIFSTFLVVTSSAISVGMMIVAGVMVFAKTIGQTILIYWPDQLWIIDLQYRRSEQVAMAIGVSLVSLLITVILRVEMRDNKTRTTTPGDDLSLDPEWANGDVILLKEPFEQWIPGNYGIVELRFGILLLWGPALNGCISWTDVNDRHFFDYRLATPAERVQILGWMVNRPLDTLYGTESPRYALDQLFMDETIFYMLGAITPSDGACSLTQA